MEEYDILWKENKVGTMYFKENGIEAIRTDESHFSPLFPKGIKSVETLHVVEWFQERVFPEGRADQPQLLAMLGLDTFNLLEIVKITCASCITDPMWVKFNQSIDFKDTIWYGFYNIQCRR